MNCVCVSMQWLKFWEFQMGTPNRHTSRGWFAVHFFPAQSRRGLPPKAFTMQSLAGSSAMQQRCPASVPSVASSSGLKPAVRPSVRCSALYTGKEVTPPKRGKHFLHLDDFSKDELLDMLNKGAMSKKKLYERDETFKPFAGQTMAMIFTKPSARTRVSFETVRRAAQGARHRHAAAPATSHSVSSSCKGASDETRSGWGGGLCGTSPH